MVSITGGRVGLSLCTSSWANGDHGPLFVSLAPRSVSNEFIQKMNEHLGDMFKRNSWSNCPNTGSPFFCEQFTVGVLTATLGVGDGSAKSSVWW